MEQNDTLTKIDKQNTIKLTKKSKKTGEEKTKFLSLLGTSFELGFAISVPMAAGSLFGVYLDRIFGSSPKMTLSLLLIGMVAGIASIYRFIKESQD